jgi:biopolymer transport protein ExbD
MSGAGRNDINVTPLIDVLLVLLVIFLVATPLMMKLEPLELPRRIDDPRVVSEIVPLVVDVRTDLSVELDDGKIITLAELARTLRPRLAAIATDKVVFIDFEDAVAWSDVVTTVDSIRSLDDVKVAVRLPQEDAHVR